MRIENTVSKALEKTGNDRYKLAIVVSKRVKQLQKGEPMLVEADPKKDELTDIALKEIAQGLIEISQD